MPRIVYYAIGLSGFFGLFLLMMAWPTLLSPDHALPTAIILLISAGPLLLPFRGLLDRNLKSCTWMSYLSLPYFAHGVAEAYAGQQWLYPALEASFSLMLCLGTGFYVYSAEKTH